MEVDQSADEAEETQTFLNMEKKPKRKKLTDTVTKQLYYSGPEECGMTVQDRQRREVDEQLYYKGTDECGMTIQHRQR